MSNNLKIIFIHGIDNQITNYSSTLFQKIIKACKTILTAKGYDDTQIHNILTKNVQHEIMWAYISTDLTNRYLQLQYSKQSHFFWDFLKKPVDPLFIQIMQYIKDKGDRETGKMSILGQIHTDFKLIFSRQDIGIDPPDANQAIIVAHSLGSVIAFDYIMGFRKQYSLQNLKKDITIKSFITLGSPIPLFTSAMGHPDSDMKLPSQVEKWVNILSPRDGVARYMKPFFRNIPIHEYEVSTGLFPIQAHTGYWKDDLTAEIIALEILSALKIPQHINSTQEVS
jgi:hypothetical protein